MGRSARSSVEVRRGWRKARGDTRADLNKLQKAKSIMRSMLVLLLNLLLPLLSFAQECRLKKDASELLSVDYYIDPSGTRYADMVAVTMVDGKKYSLELFEEGCRRVTPVNVQYKTEKETEWQEGGTRRQGHHLKDLDPCQTYLVRITVEGQTVKDFEVGPYYNQLGTDTILENEQNPHFMAATERIHRASRGMTSALVKIEAPICAKTVAITILQEGADLNQEIKKVKDNDLFLNREDRQQLETALGDFYHDDTFFTLPDPDRLKEHFTFDNTSMKLSWDLTKFFEEPCAKANGLNPNIEVVGEKQPDAAIDTTSCNSTLLEVTFGEEQTFRLTGCDLDTILTVPQSSALSGGLDDEDLDGSIDHLNASATTIHLNLAALLLLLCLVAFGL